MTDWPIKTLGELFDSEPKNSESLKQKDYLSSGKFPVVDQGQELIGGFTNDQHLVRDFETPVIVFGDHTRCVKYVDFPFASGADGTKILVPRKGVIPRYAYFQLLSIDLPTKGYARHFGELSKHSFVLPSLEEQKRIVELLDAATACVAELTACYEQARTHANNLFASALRDALESNPDWPVKTLGQVATFHNGRAYKQQELLDKGKYRVLRVGNFFSSKSWYWSDLELDEHKYCDKGDLLYAWSASFGPRIWDEEKVIYHYHIWKVVEETQQINRQFLKYWLEEDVERVKSASGTGTTMMHVSKGNIEARLISLPPLEEQKRIVAQLDSMRAKTSEMVVVYDAKLQAARDLRQSILESAFAGDL